MYVLIYIAEPGADPIVCPDITMEEIENRVLSMGLAPSEYCVVTGELIKSFDHEYHAWE
jgi:hypothetical protein